MPDLSPIVATAGWPVLWTTTVISFVTLIMRGDLVARKAYEDMRRERDFYREGSLEATKQSVELGKEFSRFSTEVARSMRPRDEPGTGQ